MRMLVPLLLALAAGCSNAPERPDASMDGPPLECGAVVCSASEQRCCTSHCGGYQFCWAESTCPEDTCDMGGRD